MATIDVTSEDLHQQAVQVHTGAARVNEILSQLTGQIQDLAGKWQSSSSEAFQGRWQEWHQGATQIHQAMEDMGNFLQQAAQTYEETEDHLRASASGH